MFDAANNHLLDLAQPLIQAHCWHGLRVVAADASRLVSTRSLAPLSADHYAFALFLHGAELTLHASLHAPDGCERQMLFQALDGLESGRDVRVLDRGYPANWTASALTQRRQDFCMRWRVEEAFKRIKHRLRLEAVSGLNHLALQQDFAAKIVVDNLHVLLAAAENPSALHPEPDSRPHRTYAFGTLKPILAGCRLAVKACLARLKQLLPTHPQAQANQAT